MLDSKKKKKKKKKKLGYVARFMSHLVQSLSLKTLLCHSTLCSCMSPQCHSNPLSGRYHGEHCLVGTINRINYSLGLLVGSIESYHNPISPPGDSGSRSTSGGAGEGPGLVIKS